MAEEKPGRVKVQAQPLRHRVDENAVVPLCDIHEAKDGTTVLEVEVPGARPETVDVRVEKGVLTI